MSEREREREKERKRERDSALFVQEIKKKKRNSPAPLLFLHNY